MQLTEAQSRELLQTHGLYLTEDCDRCGQILGHALIWAQKPVFCAQVAPKFRVLVRMIFLKFNERMEGSMAVKTRRTRFIQQRYIQRIPMNTGNSARAEEGDTHAFVV